MVACTCAVGTALMLLLGAGSAQVQEELCDALHPSCGASEQGSNMLQNKASAPKTLHLEQESEEWFSIRRRVFFGRRRTPAPTPAPPTHFIQFDGSHMTPVPRVEAQGFIREVLFKYPMNSMNLSEDGASVQIPMGQFLESQYSRDTSVTNRSDFGVQKAMMFRSNRPSMLGDKVDLMFAEKTHTLYSTLSTQDYPHHSKTKAEQDKSGRWPTTNALASTSVSFNARALAANTLASAVGPQMFANSAVGDHKHVQAVRDYVATDGLTPSDAALGRMEQASRRLAERAARAAAQPIRSAIACMHFEKSPAISYSGDDKVNITLGKKITAYRGRIMSSPNQEYDFLVGYAVFQYDAATNTLDLYFAGSHMLEVADQPSGFVAKLWIGHADGAAWPMAPESRPPTPPVSFGARAAYAQMSTVPVDYTWFGKDRSEAGCPDAALEAFEESSQEVLATLQHGSLGFVAVLMYMTSTAPCVVEYLRPDSSGSAGYGFLEALGAIHFAMEVPPALVTKSLGAHFDWNAINGLPVSSAP